MFCSVILFLFFNLAQSFCVVGERIVCVEGALELIFILTFIPSLVFSPPPVLFGMGMGGGRICLERLSVSNSVCLFLSFCNAKSPHPPPPSRVFQTLSQLG